MNTNALEPSKTQVSEQDSTRELRSKIVELLSATANGCLSELGYFPGMPFQFQQLLETNTLLQNDNKKLFHDNRDLARVVAVQNDRLAFAAGADNAKLKQFMEMKEKIESLTMERAKLTQTNEVLKASTGDQRYEKLFADAQKLQFRNNVLERDYARLRDSYSILYNAATVRGVLPPGLQKERRTNNVSANINQRGAPDTQPGSTLRHPSTNYIVQHRKQAPETVPRVANSYPSAQNHLLRQVGSVQQQPQRQTSGGYPQAIGPNFSRRNRLNSSVSQLVQISSAQSDSALSSLTICPPPSSSSNLKAPDAPPQSLKGDGTYTSTPLAMDARSLPITPISPDHTSQIPSQFVQGWRPELPLKGPQPIPDLIDLTADDARVQVTSAPTANSGGETMHSPASSVEEPLFLRRSSGKMSGLRQGAAHDEPAALNSPASSIEEPLMKRSISDMEGAQQSTVSCHEPRKRSRLNDSGQGDDTTPQVKPQVDGDNSDTEPDHRGTMEKAGLVSVEDCVAAIFTEDEEKEGEQVCSLCVLRYERGAIEELPPPFMRPPPDVLVAHCIDEHPIVWEKLRYDTSQDQ